MPNALLVGNLSQRGSILTRRQRYLLDLLVECHRVRVHPSPAHLSRLLADRSGWPSGVSPKAVRSELARLLDEGFVLDVVAVGGSAPARYRVADCPCPDCKPAPDRL